MALTRTQIDASAGIPTTAEAICVWDGTGFVPVTGDTLGNLRATLVGVDSAQGVSFSGTSGAKSPATVSIPATAFAYVFTAPNWEEQRSPSVFKPFASTAITAGTGATIWTPAAGKKFRVMGVSISTSVAGQLLFGDNLVGTVIARSPTLAAGAAWQLGAADMGNGILSAAANNVLKLDGPTGNVMGMVWGTEE